MAKPGRHTLELWAGSLFNDTWTWFADDEETSPVDLTNYTAELHLRRKRSDVTPLLTLTSAGGDIVLGGAAGTIVVTILDTATAGLVVANGWWGLEMTNTTPTPDEVRLLMEGKLVLHRDSVY